MAKIAVIIVGEMTEEEADKKFGKNGSTKFPVNKPFEMLGGIRKHIKFGTDKTIVTVAIIEENRLEAKFGQDASYVKKEEDDIGAFGGYVIEIANTVSPSPPIKRAVLFIKKKP